MGYDLYPAVDENHNFAPVILDALAKTLQLRHTIVPMTQTARNNLAGADLWDGRLVFNLDTNRINSYEAATTSWAEVANFADLTKANVGLGSVDNTADASKPVSTAQAAAINAKPNLATTGTPAMEGTASRGSSVDAARADHIHPKLTNAARILGGSAGAQWDAGGSQWYYSLGFSFGSNFLLRSYTLDPWGNYVPNEAGLKAITPGNGTVYFNNDANTSNGFVRYFRVVDLA